MLCLSPRAHARRRAPDIPSGVSGAGRDSVLRALCAFLFLACSTTTVMICRAMADMGEVPMAGGWAMSTAWTPLCGGSWAAAAGIFLGMWVTMMTAMMLPSITPTLRQLRASVAVAGEIRPGLFVALAGLAYLTVWATLGLAVFIGGALLLQAALHWQDFARAVPVVAGFAIVAAGLFQASLRKLDLLRHCRRAGSPDPGVAAAIGQGLRLGFACCASCAGLTALLLVGGAMDLRAMAVVALAITAERLASAGERIACAVGAIMLGAGAVQLASALWQL